MGDAGASQLSTNCIERWLYWSSPTLPPLYSHLWSKLYTLFFAVRVLEQLALKHHEVFLIASKMPNQSRLSRIAFNKQSGQGFRNSISPKFDTFPSKLSLFAQPDNTKRFTNIWSLGILNLTTTGHSSYFKNSTLAGTRNCHQGWLNGGKPAGMTLTKSSTSRYHDTLLTIPGESKYTRSQMRL